MFKWECPSCGFVANVPRQRDEHVCEWRKRGESNPALFKTLESWERIPHPTDLSGEYVTLKFAEGGRVSIYTTDALMWIEPERH